MAMGSTPADKTRLSKIMTKKADLQVGVPGHEEEVIVNELLPDGLLHAGEGVVGAGQVPGQIGEGLLHQVLHAQPLLLGDAGGQAESVNVAAHPTGSAWSLMESCNY
jgi:hypothetical protein